MAELKRKPRNLYGLGFLMLLVGITLIISSFKHFLYTFKEPLAIENLTTNELKKGVLVKDDIFAILDHFAYDEINLTKLGNKLSSHMSTYYYIVPVLTKDSEELYMAMEVTASKEEQIKTILEDTAAYISGKISEEDFGDKIYPVTGPIRNMTEQEILYMIEWFQTSNYFGTKEASEIRPYIHPVIIENYHPSFTKIQFILGIILTLVGATWFALGLIFNKRKAQVSGSQTHPNPKTNYTPYQTGFIKAAAPEDPLNAIQKSSFLNQQNKSNLNQQNQKPLPQQKENAMALPSEVNTTAPTVDINPPPETIDSEKTTAKQPSNTKHTTGPRLSDIFFKVDHK